MKHNYIGLREFGVMFSRSFSLPIAEIDDS